MTFETTHAKARPYSARATANRFRSTQVSPLTGMKLSLVLPIIVGLVGCGVGPIVPDGAVLWPEGTLELGGEDAGAITVFTPGAQGRRSDTATPNPARTASTCA